MCFSYLNGVVFTLRFFLGVYNKHFWYVSCFDIEKAETFGFDGLKVSNFRVNVSNIRGIEFLNRLKSLYLNSSRTFICIRIALKKASNHFALNTKPVFNPFCLHSIFGVSINFLSTISGSMFFSEQPFMSFYRSDEE